MLLAGLMLVGLVLAEAAPVLALDGSGPVRVVDGDTLVLGGESVRLAGIDAPELDQRCGAQSPGAGWRCGIWARGQLERLVSTGALRCRGTQTDRHGRRLVTCTAGGEDLGAAMVAAGAAVAYLRYSDSYAAQEAAARTAGRGIWADGTPAAPEDHRRTATRRRDPPVPAATGRRAGCLIKGNVSAHGRIYHQPGQRDYAAVRIAPSRGEGWFCSPAEAEAAGFRPARR